MPAPAPPGFYNSREAQDVLGLDKQRISYLLRTDLLPHNKIRSNHFVYPCAYIDGLAALLKIGTAHGYPADDIVFMRLWRLRHDYYDRSPYNQRHHKRVNNECAMLVESGRALRLEDFCDIMREFATTHAVRLWMRAKKLAVVQVGRSQYLSHAYAKHVHRIFATWPSLYDAAVELGVPYQTLVSQRGRGIFTSFVMPDGRARIDPIGLKSAQRPVPSENLVDLRETARRLGVPELTLRSAVRAGAIASVLVGGRRFVEDDVIAYWRCRFATINPGFEWLHEESCRLGGMKLIAPKQVGRLLGVPLSTQSGWYAANMLPYYMRGFGTDSSADKLVPARYVDGLHRFVMASDLRIGHAAARQYRAACFARQIIV